MGLMSHADVREIGDRAMLDVPVEPVDTHAASTGAVQGDGPCDGRAGQRRQSLATLRYRLKDLKFDAIEQPVKAGDIELPAGSLLVPSSAARRRRKSKSWACRRWRWRDAPECGEACRRTAAPGDVFAPGAARRTSAGCATRSTISNSPTI